MEAKILFKVVFSKSPEQTQKIAENFAKTLQSGDTVALYGSLGSGKTVFVQGLARGLGVSKKITSPTFVFAKSYPIVLGSKALTLHHLDLYRGESAKDLISLGLEEFMSKDSIVVLEWAINIKDRLPKRRIDVIIESIDEKTRKITIKRN